MRPSSGAAMSESDGDVMKSGTSARSVVAAPEDGRTPPRPPAVTDPLPNRAGRRLRRVQIGYYLANSARGPGRAIQVWAMAGRAGRPRRGVSQPVATSCVSTAIEPRSYGRARAWPERPDARRLQPIQPWRCPANRSNPSPQPSPRPRLTWALSPPQRGKNRPTI